MKITSHFVLRAITAAALLLGAAAALAQVVTPSMTVTFAPASVQTNTAASMTLTLTNPVMIGSIISGSITIPAGLAATPPGSNSCGTTGSVVGGIYSFAGGNIPALSSCTIVLSVQSAAAAMYTVTVPPAALNTLSGANTNTSSATLTVTAAPPPPPVVAMVVNTADSGAGSLRQAIIIANAAGSCVTATTINFNIAGVGLKVINIFTPLPTVSCPNTTIDAYTQPGASANTLASGNNAVIAVTLDGTMMTPPGSGLTLNGNNIAVRGLAIYKFIGQPGIRIQGGAGVKIEGNFIGTDALGTSALPNGVGIEMSSGSFALIGNASPAARNVISGNTGKGIFLSGASGTAGSQIRNNYIGTEKTGTANLANGGDGINVTVPNAEIDSNFIRFNAGNGVAIVGSGAGPADIHDNDILSNGGSGVLLPPVQCMPEGVTILRNNIGLQGGGGFGIDLGDFILGAGRDTNSTTLTNPKCNHGNGGSVSVPFRAQNFPIITGVDYVFNGASATSTVNATLSSAPGTAYNIELFSNYPGALDTANRGVGATYITSKTTLPTDASGLVTFQVVTSGTPIHHPTLTATTPVGPTGGTSEFSVQAITPLLYTSTYSNFSIVAGSSQSQAFVFLNDDSVPVNVPTPTTSLPAFTVTSNTCGLVAAGASCQIVVAYSQTVAITDTAILSISPVSSASSPFLPVTAQPPISYSWALVGTATAPVVAATPTSVTFASTAQGTESLPQTVTVTNSGASAMTLSVPTSSLPVFFISATTCGTSLPGMSSCTISVTLRPSPTATTGPTSGSLSLTTSAGLVSVALSGSVAAYAATVTPAPVAFPTTTVLTNSVSQTATFTNSSAGSINVAAVDLTGTNTADFQLLSTTCAGIIASMGNCTAVVRFSPQTIGTKSASVRFASGAGAITLGGLTGNAVAAALPPTLSLSLSNPTTAPGNPVTLILNLANVGATSLTAGAFTFTYPAGIVTVTAPAISNTCGGSVTSTAGSSTLTASGLTLGPSGSCSIGVGVTSVTGGSYVFTFPAGAFSSSSGSNAVASNATLTVISASVGPFAYVPNFASFSGNTVSVIDTPTNTVIATVTVGLGPVTAVVNSAGSRAYISNQQGNSISVINTATNAVVATIPVGSQPAGVAVNPAGTRVYAPNQTSNDLTVIDATTNTVITSVGGLAFPVGAVVNAAGTKVYVTTFTTNAVAVIDAATNTVIATIPVCASPFLPVLNATGNRLYVDCTSGNISVIDTASNTLVTTIPVGANTRGIAINASGSVLYATNNGSNNISVISTATNMVTATIAAPGSPMGGALNPAGTRLYVANSGTNNVSVFDTSTNSLVTTVAVGANPFGVGIVPAAAGPTPNVTLAPGVLTFGTRTVGTTSPVSTATLGNSGTALLTILSITASGDYAFTTSCPLAPSTLAVGIACPINVTFSPLAVGARAGNIAIVSNAPGSPHAIALSGTGSGGAVANISLAPAALAFAAQTVNTNSALQRVVVSNSGFANLLISNISISAPFSRVPLGAVAPPDCGGSVAPGNSCQIGVIFSPASGGPLTGQISIIDNATGSPHTVGLSGTGVAVPVAVISASALLAFGDQVINSTGSVQNLTISNSGSATLNISAITLTGTHAANFNLTGQSGCVSIAPAGSCILPITFITTTIGAKIAQVNITSDAQNAALVNTVNLTGNGILAPRPVVNITATAIGYGNVIFGGATPNQIVTLTNSGGQAMNIPSIVVTGDFVQMNNCGTRLASLASCTISIIFTPLGQGARFGELILTSSATSSPDRIQLSGTGCRWFSQAQSRFFLTSCG